MPRPRPLPIWRDLTGGVDYSRPPFHPQYPPRRSPELQNVLVSDGVNVKWPGRMLYTTGLLPGPVRFLCDFLLSTGTRYLVASEGSRVFVHDPGQSAWSDISPQYTTGTASGTLGSAQVTGTGTEWVSYGISAGDLLQFTGDETTYTIASVQSDTALTLTQACGRTISGPYTISKRLAPQGADWIRGVVADDQLILVNGCDRPWCWQPNTSERFTVLGYHEDSVPPPVARCATTFHMRNLLVMGRMWDDNQQIAHSDANDYQEWTTGLAETYDFHAMAGDIMGLDGGHEFLFIFMSDGIWRGVWSGTDVRMEFAQVPAATGVLAANSLLRLGSQGAALQEGALTQWAYLGSDGFYSFDGERVRPIGNEVRAWLFDKLDSSRLNKLQSTVVPKLHLALWSFPTLGSNGVCTHSVALDYTTGEWFVSALGYSCLGRYALNAEDAEWDSVTGAIDSQTRTFDPDGSLATPVTVVGDAAGHVHYLDLGKDDLGVPINARRRTATVTPAPGEAVDIAEVTVQTTAPAGTSLTVSVLGGENPAQLTKAEGHTVAVGSTGEARCAFSLAAQSFAVEIENSAPGEQFGLVSVTPYVVRRGR